MLDAGGGVPPHDVGYDVERGAEHDAERAVAHDSWNCPQILLMKWLFVSCLRYAVKAV